MGIRFEDSYLGTLRKHMGHAKLLNPAVRACIIQDSKVLLIQRKDTLRYGMPAGSVELGESVFEAMQREVKEETGLDVISADAIALYSDPKYSVTYPNGDEIQQFTLVFKVTQWSGDILQETDESWSCKFYPIDELPDVHEVYKETLEDILSFDGKFIVK